jgi:hypothetical protein
MFAMFLIVIASGTEPCGSALRAGRAGAGAGAGAWGRARVCARVWVCGCEERRGGVLQVWFYFAAYLVW